MFYVTIFIEVKTLLAKIETLLEKTKKIPAAKTGVKAYKKEELLKDYETTNIFLLEPSQKCIVMVSDFF